ncbi:MAG TPA: hypothetical protein PLI03_13810, partial [Chitinophagales bacterium]|nr:hypothetical protein [Chitinophagales bacterium]
PKEYVIPEADEGGNQESLFSDTTHFIQSTMHPPSRQSCRHQSILHDQDKPSRGTPAQLSAAMPPSRSGRSAYRQTIFQFASC